MYNYTVWGNDRSKKFLTFSLHCPKLNLMRAFRTQIWVFAALLIFAFSVVLEASARISEFYAKREKNTVILEWTTEEESNLAKFEIYRSTDQMRWHKIGETRAVGESSQRNAYSLTDNSIFKGAVNTLYYRLVLVDKTGNSQSWDVIASVEGQSGIRHTWGSIKAMFR
jgi:hypothetical protein